MPNAEEHPNRNPWAGAVSSDRPDTVDGFYRIPSKVKEVKNAK